MKTVTTRVLLLLALALLPLVSGCCTSKSARQAGGSSDRAMSGGGWHVVYVNDAGGKRTSGDLGTLVAAVKAGRPIRVMTEAKGDVARYDLEMVCLRGSVVSGTTPTQVSLMRDNDGSLVFKEKSYHVINGFSTSGVYTQFSWSLAGTNWQYPGPWTGSSAMTWMVGE
ncbi:MAG: hypothetical protein NTW19_04520 [Planctomycetota bacterium]|nr:hypothetical protein [Planctomycetota bacterium]